MAEATPFILLATQRTGSSWMQEMLGSHPRMRVYTELFLAGSRGYPMWEPNDVEFVDSYLASHVRGPVCLTRPYWIVRYLRLIYDQPEVSAVGFKYMYDQIRRSPEVLLHAAVRRVRIVHLIRGNLLDTVISSRLAQATGLYHLAGDNRPKVPWWPSERVETTVRLEIPDLIVELERLTRERERIRRWLRTARVPVLEVQYERLASDPASAFAPVVSFLGLPESDASLLNSALQKVRTRSQPDVVENFDEVRSALLGSPYAACLQT